MDGKPLYEKTVDFGSLPNATAKEVPHGIEDVDIILTHDGYILYENCAVSSLNLPDGNVFIYQYVNRQSVAIAVFFQIGIAVQQYLYFSTQKQQIRGGVYE